MNFCPHCGQSLQKKASRRVDFPWKRWFAWHPIRFEKKWLWCKWIERRAWYIDHDIPIPPGACPLPPHHDYRKSKSNVK